MILTCTVLEPNETKKTNEIKFIINSEPSITLEIWDYKEYFSWNSSTVNFVIFHLQRRLSVYSCIFAHLRQTQHKSILKNLKQVQLSLRQADEISLSTKFFFWHSFFAIDHCWHCFIFLCFLSGKRTIEKLSGRGRQKYQQSPRCFSHSFLVAFPWIKRKFLFELGHSSPALLALIL